MLFRSDLAAARSRKETLWRQMQQAKADAERNSRELQELLTATDKARFAARTATANDLNSLRIRKEYALRALIAETLKDEDKALADARTAAARIRADVTARDPEAVALTNRIAELNTQRNALRKTRDELQAALRAHRTQGPEGGNKPQIGRAHV